MFSELVESVVRPSDKRKRWALLISAALQTGCLLILVLIPLIDTQALPKAVLNTVLVGFSQPAPQPPAPATPVRSASRPVRLLNHRVLTAPTRIPRSVTIIDEPELPPEAADAGPTAAGQGMDLLDVAPGPVERLSRPAPGPSVPRRVPVTSTIEAAKLISQVRPAYPALALQARIQGNVVLHAVISKDGAVSELQVLSGHPLLVNAAVAAVRQWRYSPTLLSGQAVEVETTITVSFVLGE